MQIEKGRTISRPAFNSALRTTISTQDTFAAVPPELTE